MIGGLNDRPGIRTAQEGHRIPYVSINKITTKVQKAYWEKL